MRVTPAGERIPTLDGWRGIAILLVLISHGGTAMRHIGLCKFAHAESIGQQGVAIFFVLSGFLITSKLLQEKQRNGTINLRSFYVSRFFRLMPTAWVYLATLVLITLLSGERLSILNLPSCLFFYRNFLQYSATTAHFWSLSIEEQFYIIWPVLLFLLGVHRARWLVLAGAGCIAAIRFTHRAALIALPIQATFSTQYRADALLLGCAAALFMPTLKRHLARWMVLPLLSCLCWFMCHNYYLIPLYESATVALLLTATSAFPDTLVSKMLSSKMLRLLGAISYSLYLWQQLALLASNKLSLAIVSLILPAISLGSYHLIERPFIRIGQRFSAVWGQDRRGSDFL
jgi:peptidoglycan/LPS O-acetylase OafA/YrhL